MEKNRKMHSHTLDAGSTTKRINIIYRWSWHKWKWLFYCNGRIICCLCRCSSLSIVARTQLKCVDYITILLWIYCIPHSVQSQEHIIYTKIYLLVHCHNHNKSIARLFQKHHRIHFTSNRRTHHSLHIFRRLNKFSIARHLTFRFNSYFGVNSRFWSANSLFGQRIVIQ